MTDFSMGSSGPKGKLARALATGTKVVIAALRVVDDPFGRTDKKTGEKKPAWKLEAVFQPVQAGTTVAYTRKGQNGQVNEPAVAYQANEQFVHPYGGVYRNPTGVKITDAGGAGEFLTSLKEAGAEITGNFSDLVGTVITLDVQTRTSPIAGKYRIPLCQSIEGKIEVPAPVGNTAGAAPAAPGSGKKIIGKKASSTPNAFTSLNADDQSAVREYLEGNAAPDPEDLVGTVANDIEQAKAILAAAQAVAA